jgi:hypothetical protein
MFINHPKYKSYSANPKTGEIKTKKGLIIKGREHKTGYYMFGAYEKEHKQKMFFVHRFVWECVNGEIQDKNLVIDHINNDKKDNRIDNLQLITQQENCKKSAKTRDYTFVGKNWSNKKNICATNKETGEKIYFKSLYQCSKELGINAGVISMCCQGLNGVKSGKSKTTNAVYKFEYVNETNV